MVWVMVCLMAQFLMTCKKDKISANDTLTPNSFLSANRFDKLMVEIQSVTGHEPTGATLTNLQNFLEQRLNKPGGIGFTSTSISAQGKSSYSFTDIQEIEKKNRTQNTNGKLAAAYILFLDGDYAANSGNSKVLGIAYGTSSMAIFEKTIRDFSGNIGQPATTTLETAVIHHEFGHTLGLVNNGTKMVSGHQDSPNGAHCNNKNCLMYFATETSDIVGALLGGSVPNLDDNCISDLRANGGK